MGSPKPKKLTPAQQAVVDYLEADPTRLLAGDRATSGARYRWHGRDNAGPRLTASTVWALYQANLLAEIPRRAGQPWFQTLHCLASQVPPGGWPHDPAAWREADASRNPVWRHASGICAQAWRAGLMLSRKDGILDGSIAGGVLLSPEQLAALKWLLEHKPLKYEDEAGGER